MNGDSDKMVGGVLLAIGAAVLFFGIMRLNSFQSQLASLFDKTDTTAIGAVVGAVAALAGVVMLANAKKAPRGGPTGPEEDGRGP